MVGHQGRYIRQPWLMLLLVIALGGLLRGLNLGEKALWLDELLTAIFSLGRGIADIPQAEFISVSAVRSQLSLNPEASCQQIAITLSRESTHPPLFFCWLQHWLRLIAPLNLSLAQQLRSLPALLGILAIPSLYWLNRLAFSRKAGLLAAALIALSPFAVYLSQEARHYTLPLLLISLSLGALVRWGQGQWGDRPLPRGTRPLWVLCHSIGLYSHYFMAIAYIAQIATYLSLSLALKFAPSLGIKPRVISENPSSRAIPLSHLLSLILPGLVFLPWLSHLGQHLQRSETDWFQPFEPSWTDHFAPLLQTLASWVVMWVTLPVEHQPWAIAIPAAVAMVALSLGLGIIAWRGGQHLWRSPASRLPLLILILVTLWSLLGFVFIVYGLGKDITIAPRYHFVYYPSLCALVAAALSTYQSPKIPALALIMGGISSLVVISGLAFEKPYQPRQVAQQLQRSPASTLEVVIGYENSQEIALGLSFALELPPETAVAFLPRDGGYEQTWQQLAQLPGLSASQPSTRPEVDLWIIAPGLREAEYPQQVEREALTCDRRPDDYYRLGIPYQRYHCQPSPV
jgi:uncharacterized membrane protein